MIRVLNIVDRCYSNADGTKLFAEIHAQWPQADQVVVSFSGVLSVPSSFVNSAFVPLLAISDYEKIKQKLRIVDSTRQINQMIKQRLQFETQRQAALGNVTLTCFQSARKYHANLQKTDFLWDNSASFW